MSLQLDFSGCHAWTFVEAAGLRLLSLIAAVLVPIPGSGLVRANESSPQSVDPVATAMVYTIPRQEERARLTGKWHTIQVEPRPGLPKIHWYDKMNPVWWFKNVDEPDPPKWYLPHSKARKLKWRFRNSFHNFNNYVIGIGDRRFTRSGRYPEVTSNPHGGWNFAVSKYKWIRLPFVSYRRGKFQSYLGWRDHGNFGAKVNVKREKPRPEPISNFKSQI